MNAPTYDATTETFVPPVNLYFFVQVKEKETAETITS